MHVGIDISSLTPQRTGVGHFTASLLVAMMDDAPEVEFHAFSSGMAPVDLRGVQGLTSHHHVSLPTRLLYRLWDHTGRPRVDRMLPGIDVYHATNYFLPPLVRARSVVTLYDLTFLKHPEWCSPKIVGPFSRNVRRRAAAADAVLTCSHSSKSDIEELLGIPGDRIHITQGAVDPHFVAYDRPQAVDFVARSYGIQQPYILFTGTLEPRKNITGILETFAWVAADIPHTLVLAGAPGWYGKSLAAELRRLNILDRVRHIGYAKQHSDLSALYAAADCFFFPSHYEGFGLPVLEAMACGCPVITSRVSSLPEVGGEAVRYVDPNDIEGMAATLLMVVKHESIRESLSALGVAEARKFSWARAAEETLAVYRSIG